MNRANVPVLNLAKRAHELRNVLSCHLVSTSYGRLAQEQIAQHLERDPALLVARALAGLSHIGRELQLTHDPLECHQVRDVKVFLGFLLRKYFGLRLAGFAGLLGSRDERVVGSALGLDLQLLRNHLRGSSRELLADRLHHPYRVGGRLRERLGICDSTRYCGLILLQLRKLMREFMRVDLLSDFRSLI